MTDIINFPISEIVGKTTTIVGKRVCGKTTLILNLIKLLEKNQTNDVCYIITSNPTMHDYDYLKSKGYKIINKLDAPTLQKILRESKNRNITIVYDDYVIMLPGSINFDYFCSDLYASWKTSTITIINAEQYDSRDMLKVDNTIYFTNPMNYRGSLINLVTVNNLKPYEIFHYNKKKVYKTDINLKPKEVIQPII